MQFLWKNNNKIEISSKIDNGCEQTFMQNSMNTSDLSMKIFSNFMKNRRYSLKQ